MLVSDMKLYLLSLDCVVVVCYKLHSLNTAVSPTKNLFGEMYDIYRYLVVFMFLFQDVISMPNIIDILYITCKCYQYK